MFGLIKHDGKYLQMGLDLEVKAQRIITMDRSMDEEMQSTFIKNFRRIASVSVGRVLLYRLLIEIWRTDENGDGCVEYGIDVGDEEKIIRNDCRQIEIAKACSNAFDLENKRICLYPSNDQHKTNVIDKTKNGFMDLVEIRKYKRPDNVAVVHEMLHWFHTLRDIQRTHKEVYVDVGRTLLENISMESHSPSYWLTKIVNNIYVKLEEMRTILGYRLLLMR